MATIQAIVQAAVWLISGSSLETSVGEAVQQFYIFIKTAERATFHADVEI